MPIFIDQLNREIFLPAIPERVISVVPSQTELLFYLGLGDRVVGITKFCVHPHNKFKSTTKVGGTKKLDIAKIIALKPDLIIANKEENERGQIEELMNLFPVWISEISNLVEGLDMITAVGALVGKANEAAALRTTIQYRFDAMLLPPAKLRVAYLIWRKPYMVAGTDTFIDNLLQKCGFVNAFADNRYPEMNAETLIKAAPDVIFLSSEPYPFKEKHFVEFKAMLPSVQIKLVDGEFFSWYGSRLLNAPAYFEGLIKGLV